MRNLKKFLALVLAMMMAFSLMVTASAANEADNGTYQYNDTNTISAEFVEAVDVLYGMGIMTGDYGSFKGNQPIMRSEMATVLYRLMTGDTTQLKSPLYASIATERFSDVNETDWFAPYIGWCYDAGLTVGNNGKFNPWGNVTGYEAEIFVLRAMGYGRNGEYSGVNWNVNASYDATRIGLLTDVNKTSFSSTLKNAARRDVVASIVFWAAQLPTVTWNGSTYNQYVGVALGTGGNILNPSLGEKYFGLTSHYGIVLGNKATGETGPYPTKIGFSVNPTINKGLNVGDDVALGSALVKGTLTDAEITDVIDNNAYYYATDTVDAENVTLSFDWDTDLDLFAHKVKVWYDARGTSTTNVGVSGTNYIPSTVSFGTNCKTYALYDEATSYVTTAKNADLADTSDDAMGDVIANHGSAFFNYSFARMDSTNYGSNAAACSSAASPIKSNNGVIDGDTTATDYPLYLVVCNDGGNIASVIISLDLTISRVVQDNDTQAPFNTGILTENGAGTAYFDLMDQITPSATATLIGGDYSNIANANMVDSDDVALRDYVAAVTVTGTNSIYNDSGVFKIFTGKGDASSTQGTAIINEDGGAAGRPNTMNSTFYYKVDKLGTPVSKTVWKYDAATQEVFFSDGTSYKRSIFALAVDGSFKASQYVSAPTQYGTYDFYLDKDGNYLFWEEGSDSVEFIYATYIDFETEVASSQFRYPLVYVTSEGEQRQLMDVTEIQGIAMDITHYGNTPLPKRDDNQTYTGSNSGFVPGTYYGFARSGSKLWQVTDTNSRNTGFLQASITNFGEAGKTTVINSTGVSVGAVPVSNADSSGVIDTLGVYNADHLFLTETTKFVVVDGAGTANQTATTYNGLKAFLGTYGSVKIDGTTGWATDRTYLSGPDYATYGMIYYSLADETYDQIYDPSAKVIGTVFIPAELITRTSVAANGDLYFVGNNAYNIINADDDATLYTMYHDGFEETIWIAGQPNGTAGDGINSADIIQELGPNVFYQLVKSGTAHDGMPIYKVQAITNANSSIIGKYYSTASNTVPGQTTIDAATAGQGYLATTRNSQTAFIGGRGGNDLFNVAHADVLNLYSDYTIHNLTDLNGQSSLTSNQGVYVSCVLSSTGVVSLIYVNTVQAP